MLSYLNAITPPPSPDELKPFLGVPSPKPICGVKRSAAAGTPEQHVRKKQMLYRETKKAGRSHVIQHVMQDENDLADAMSAAEKGVDISQYTHEGTFIPAVLLALSRSSPCTTALSPPMPSPALSPLSTPSTSPLPAGPPLALRCNGQKLRNKPYVCKFCNKSFTNIGNLATHCRTHTREKPFRCEKCGLDFAHTSNLQRHQLVHTGVKSNKCGYCGKSFSRSDYLKVHERTHTGEKPYQCGLCEKKFLDSSSLKKHMKTHQNNGTKKRRLPRDKTPNPTSGAKNSIPSLVTEPLLMAPKHRLDTYSASRNLLLPVQSSVRKSRKIAPQRPIPLRIQSLSTPNLNHRYSNQSLAALLSSITPTHSSNISNSNYFSAFLPFPS